MLDWDKVVILARTRPQPDSEAIFEYGLLLLDRNDLYGLPFSADKIRQASYGRQPTLAVRRRTDLEWDTLWLTSTAAQAAMSIGDTMYWQAESVHPLHTFVRLRAKHIKDLFDRLLELQESLTPCKWTRQSPLEEEYEALDVARLKEARLYSAVTRGTAPADKVAKILERVSAEYRQEIARREAAIAELEVAIAELKLLKEAPDV